jgi:flagellar biosynthesis protein FliQ
MPSEDVYKHRRLGRLWSSKWDASENNFTTGRETMELELVTSIGRNLVMTTLVLVAPVVIVSLVVGIAVSIFQTITSIQEQTLSFAPRIVAAVVVMMMTLPWTLNLLQDYTINLFEQMVLASQQ